MQNILNANLGSFQAGTPLTAQGLSIIPILRSDVPKHSYLSLHQAFEQNLITISEVSEGGSVPQLKVSNSGSLPVLILDGEELRGAKQNRVLNTSVLLSGGSDYIVPVSCTEAGRWNYQSVVFQESGIVMPPRAKSAKMESVTLSMQTAGTRQSDQSRVWDDVAELHRSLGSHSFTAAMTDAFESRRQSLDEVLEAFPLQPGQCGIYAEIGGKFAGLDLVSLPAVWADVHAKIIHSYAIEILDGVPKAHPVEAQTLELFWKRLLASNIDKFEGVGLGLELRLQQPSLVGSALLWDDALVHLGAYPRRESMQQERYHSPRRRFGDDFVR